MADPVDEYRRRFPDTGVPAAQEQDRAERRAFDQERSAHRRTGRVRGVVIPELPWKKEAVDDGCTQDLEDPRQGEPYASAGRAGPGRPRTGDGDEDGP